MKLYSIDNITVTTRIMPLKKLFSLLFLIKWILKAYVRLMFPEWNPNQQFFIFQNVIRPANLSLAASPILYFIVGYKM